MRLQLVIKAHSHFIPDTLYFDEFKSFALSLDDKTDNVKQLKEHLIRFPLLKANIKYVIDNFKFIADAIYQLEKEDASLDVNIGIFESVGKVIETISDRVFEEYERVVSNNPGFEQLKEIRDILFGKSQELSTKELILEDIQCFLRAPVTNASVERSFSKYRLILTDYRHRLSEDSLKQLITISYNKNILSENNSFNM